MKKLIEMFDTFIDPLRWTTLSAEAHDANVTDIRLPNKGQFISEEVLLDGELPEILAGFQVKLDVI